MKSRTEDNGSSRHRAWQRRNGLSKSKWKRRLSAHNTEPATSVDSTVTLGMMTIVITTHQSVDTFRAKENCESPQISGRSIFGKQLIAKCASGRLSYNHL